jgi:DNA topoisomerase-2
MDSKDTLKYEKFTDREQVLTRPSMYIGSMSEETTDMWILDPKINKFIRGSLTYIPAFISIVREILVNAADQVTRDETCTQIDVIVDKQTGIIIVKNNGKGIPAAKHQKYNIWTPQMIFSDFRTSSNYARSTKKTKTFTNEDLTGGCNGFGAKTTNVFSKAFIVETIDSGRKILYKQVFKDNLNVIDPPTLTENVEDESYTCITFLPDYERFGHKELTMEHFCIIQKMVYDIAGNSLRPINVTFNNAPIGINSFVTYASMFYASEKTFIHHSINNYWEFCIGSGNGCISFVNAVEIRDGGTHSNFIYRKLCESTKDKQIQKLLGLKTASLVTISQLQKCSLLIIKSFVADPEYEAQSKVRLTTNCRSFRTISSSYVIDSSVFIKLIKQTPVGEMLRILISSKDAALIKNIEKKTQTINVPKYEGAELARRSMRNKDTYLFITEGLSAAAGAMIGRGIFGPDIMGILPVRGKPINVMSLTQQSILKNDVIQNIRTVTGIRTGQIIKSTRDLRYDHIVLFTDQDWDGIHIRMLLINIYIALLPIIKQFPDFLMYFSTPLVKSTNKKLVFHSMYELNKWANDQGVTWTKSSADKFKFHKGLGSIAKEDMKQYFREFKKHVSIVTFDDNFSISLNLAFNKNKTYADKRKHWLESYDESDQLLIAPTISVTDMVHKQLKHFSMSDNVRSIPNLMCGLKECQRKVLHYFINKGPVNEKSLIILGGGIIEYTQYHHGDTSLYDTIFGMGQSFVGTNNIPYLHGGGAFGSRVYGGDDAAQARYPSTKLNAITKLLFRKDEYPLLPIVDEFGSKLEPYYFLPPIPMIFINGCLGIGTGYKSEILQFNPLDVIMNVIRLIKKEPYQHMLPWYKGYTGNVREISSNCSYEFTGKYTINGNCVHITELPIGVWTGYYTEYLSFLQTEKNVKGNKKTYHMSTFNANLHKRFGKSLIADVIKRNTDDTVNIIVKFESGALDLLKDNEIIQYLSLYSLHSMSLVAFDDNIQLRTFSSIQDMFETWFGIRNVKYMEKKEILLNNLMKEYKILKNKVNFIHLCIDKIIDIDNKEDDVVTNILLDHKLEQIPTFEYLLSMQIRSRTKKKKEELEQQLLKLEEKINILNKLSHIDIWYNEISEIMQTLY